MNKSCVFRYAGPEPQLPSGGCANAVPDAKMSHWARRFPPHPAAVHIKFLILSRSGLGTAEQGSSWLGKYRCVEGNFK